MFNKSIESDKRTEIVAFNCEEFGENNFGDEKRDKNTIDYIKQKLLSSDY